MATTSNNEKQRDKLKQIEYNIKKLLIIALLLGWSKQQYLVYLVEETNKVKELNLIDKKAYIDSFLFTFLSLYDKLHLKENPTIFVREILETIPKDNNDFSIYAKFDIDLNAFNQMKKVYNAINSGYDLRWLSAHIDCSDRCKPRQGKLVSMSYDPIDSDFWTGRVVEGHKVYSFTAIENQTDKYGYHNNIINGFNCRHFLYKWTKGSKPMDARTHRHEDKLYQLNREKLTMERTLKDYVFKTNLAKAYDEKYYKLMKKKFYKLLNTYFKYCKHNKLYSSLIEIS